MDEFTELLKQFKNIDEPSPSIMGKVLIIDDDPNIRQGLERTLRQKNYAVSLSSSGQEGIDSLTDDINVILLDVKMPKMDGPQTYSIIKGKRPNIPIIFYSAYPGDEKIAKKCLELKPYAFIEKGVATEIDRLYLLIDKAANEQANDNG